MTMKKAIYLFFAVCILLAGCAGSAEEPKAETTPQTIPQTAAPETQAEPVATVYPLPDTTMENLTDAILSVSLEEGDAYVDDTGKMQMDVKIYTYDRYDMVDISMLKVGDTIVTHGGEVEVISLEQNAYGTILINGGLDEDGMDLVTDDSGVYYATGFSDIKYWYEIGEATIRVSVDFEGRDNADPERGEVIYYPGSFLIGEVTDYNFTPYNTTIRVENGQIIELIRRYTP